MKEVLQHIENLLRKQFQQISVRLGSDTIGIFELFMHCMELFHTILVTENIILEDCVVLCSQFDRLNLLYCAERQNFNNLSIMEQVSWIREHEYLQHYHYEINKIIESYFVSMGNSETEDKSSICASSSNISDANSYINAYHRVIMRDSVETLDMSSKDIFTPSAVHNQAEPFMDYSIDDLSSCHGFIAK